MLIDKYTSSRSGLVVAQAHRFPALPWPWSQTCRSRLVLGAGGRKRHGGVPASKKQGDSNMLPPQPRGKHPPAHRGARVTRREWLERWGCLVPAGAMETLASETSQGTSGANLPT